jgi:hypothetical protein
MEPGFARVSEYALRALSGGQVAPDFVDLGSMTAKPASLTYSATDRCK